MMESIQTGNLTTAKLLKILYSSENGDFPLWCDNSKTKNTSTKPKMCSKMTVCQKSRFLVCYEGEGIKEKDEGESTMILPKKHFSYLHDELYIYYLSANSQRSSRARYIKLKST